MSTVDSRSVESLSEQLRHVPGSEYSDSESLLHFSHNGNDFHIAESRHENGGSETLNNVGFNFIPRSMSSSSLTECVPSLTQGSSLTSSHNTARTDAFETTGAFYDPESNNGQHFQSTNDFVPIDDLLCPFQILDCCETFSNVREFKTHIFSHFRGHSLPTSAICFLCPSKFQVTDQEDSAIAWNDMLSHLANDHFRRGQEYGTMRPDFALMRWMYDRKIISDHVFKRTQTCPVTTVFPAGSRRPSEASSIIPEVPSPPSGSSMASTISELVVWPSRSSYSTQIYVTVAGPRAERRRRESNRSGYPALRPITG